MCENVNICLVAVIGTLKLSLYCERIAISQSLRLPFASPWFSFLFLLFKLFFLLNCLQLDLFAAFLDSIKPVWDWEIDEVIKGCTHHNKDGMHGDVYFRKCVLWLPDHWCVQAGLAWNLKVWWVVNHGHARNKTTVAAYKECCEKIPPYLNAHVFKVLFVIFELSPLWI